MHELYELKEKLLDELKEYGGKEMSAGSLDVIDKLAHATKNLCKVIEAYEEEGYSERDGGGSYRGEGSYYRGSYARRRDSRGRYSSRRGGSSYRGEGNYYRAADDITEKLQEMMDSAPDEKTRAEIQKLISKMEMM